MAQPMVRQVKRAWADARIVLVARTGPLGIEIDENEPPKFELSEADRERARGMLQSVGIGIDERPIAVHPGSARTVLAEAKRWPPNLYGQLIPRLREKFGAEVLVLEGP